MIFDGTLLQSTFPTLTKKSYYGHQESPYDRVPLSTTYEIVKVPIVTVSSAVLIETRAVKKILRA